MRIFQTFLVIFLLLLIGFTAKVISAYGISLLPVFFGDIAQMGWPGQFNLDFLGFLILSAVWTAWRDNFSLKGLGLAVLAFFFGMGFLALYLLVLMRTHAGDMRLVLLGQNASAPQQNISTAP